MSITVTVNASNDTFRSVMIEEQVNGHDATVRDVLSLPQVREFFGTDDADEVCENLVGYNDSEIGDSIRGMILGSKVESDADIDIDLEGEEDEPAAEEEAAEGDAAADSAVYANGRPGIVQVFTSGGSRSTSIPVVNGTTTVQQAVYNDTLRASAGMTDSQLNQHIVQLNGSVVQDLAGATVKHGDIITLTVRSAFKNGR